jgi:hypothetical protein
METGCFKQLLFLCCGKGGCGDTAIGVGENGIEAKKALISAFFASIYLNENFTPKNSPRSRKFCLR